MNDLTPNDLSHLTDEEFQALCPVGEHAPGPEPLSPAAQAVLDAFGNASDGEYIEGVWIVNEQSMLAAALRSAADQVVPDVKAYLSPGTASQIRSDILRIAAELEGAR